MLPQTSCADWDVPSSIGILILPAIAVGSNTIRFWICLPATNQDPSPHHAENGWLSLNQQIAIGSQERGSQEIPQVSVFPFSRAILIATRASQVCNNFSPPT